MGCGCCGRPPELCECWRGPRDARVRRVPDLPAAEAPPPHKLGQAEATAICGNDITSSCLYVSALVALYAGPWAPVALLVVAGVLYLFRGIYAEVGSALPLNGGAYTLLLNTSRKWRAALAGGLVLLSYMATAVISASEAAHYLGVLVPVPAWSATLGILVLFAGLAIWGIGESAKVALGIFVLHMVALVVLVVLCGAAVAFDPGLLIENFRLSPEAWPTPRTGWLPALFLGFAAGMLGISGFESSANYIEEQKPGVFPKTLRNMWIAVALFNPLIALLALGLVPLGELPGHKEALLSELIARAAGSIGMPGGEPLSAFLALDATLVLCGAVLTSFVGVAGLSRRMSLDLVLPSELLKVNRRGTLHRPLVLFALGCMLVYGLAQGRVETLAGVYTFSFLSVMALFAVGNLLLQQRHPHLARTTRAPRWTVLLALIAVLVALVGNLLLDPRAVLVFAGFGLVGGATLLVSLYRVAISTWLLDRGWLPSGLRGWVRARVHEQVCQRLVVLLREGTPQELEAMAQEILEDEPVQHVSVLLFHEGEPDRDRIADILAADRAHPALQIEPLLVPGRAEPGRVQALATHEDVPLNHVLLAAGTLPPDTIPGARLLAF